MTGPSTVPGWDLNPGPLSLEEGALLTELRRPVEISQRDELFLQIQQRINNIFSLSVCEGNMTLMH